MLRRLHSLPGVALALGLCVVALTGTALSVQPALDRLESPGNGPGVSAAALADAVAARHERVEVIRQRADGAMTVAFSDGGVKGVERVDPATGAGLGPYKVSETTRLLINLHRSFLLGDAGRAAAGIGALAMLVLAISGAAMLARRLGGASALLRPIRGTPAQRWHAELGRFALVGLTLSSLTGLFMSASTFGLLPENRTDVAAAEASGGAPAPVGSLAALRAVDVAELRELIFPAEGDPLDAYKLRTFAGEALIDPATGAQLAFAPASMLDRLLDVIRTLHTGRGAWALGLWLGLSCAAVPALGATGFVMWLRRRSARPRIAANVSARSADTVILVGSEGNSTWGFAATLHAALSAAGHRVHTAAMNDLAPVHAKADRLLVLTATYGDGAAPTSAQNFLARLAAVKDPAPVAVLGFGDRNFPRFCGFAEDVSAAFNAKGWPRLLPMKRVDRRSAQEFAQWGRDLGAILGHDLALEHIAEQMKTTTLELVEREDYGVAAGAPVAILNFRAADAGGRGGRLPVFEPGDLLGVLPPGAAMPRFYSLASSSREGLFEICVRRRERGLCSGFLHALARGDRIEAFVRENPSFRPAAGKAPLILIGAGAGVGPLAGFVRANDQRRPIHLYFGGRSPSSDFLYEHELAQRLAEKRLTSLRVAFSRAPDGGAYVQDRIAADAPRLRELIRQGAQILVCGGRDMAEAVTHTLDAVVRPLGLDLATLKSRGHYVEDVY